MIGMVGVIACNWLILIAQYQLRRNSKSTVNVYVASLSASAIIFACIFAPTVFTAYFQTMAPTYVCLAIPYIQLVCVSSTAFCLVAVAADLYVMVVRATGPAQLHGSPNHQSSPASWRSEPPVQPSFMAVRINDPAQLHGDPNHQSSPASWWSHPQSRNQPALCLAGCSHLLFEDLHRLAETGSRRRFQRENG